MTWRAWVAFAGVGCAGALACRGDRLAAAGVGVCAVLAVAWLVRCSLLAARERLRALPGLTAEVAAAAAAPRPVKVRGLAAPYDDEGGV